MRDQIGTRLLLPWLELGRAHAGVALPQHHKRISPNDFANFFDYFFRGIHRALFFVMKSSEVKLIKSVTNEKTASGSDNKSFNELLFAPHAFSASQIIESLGVDSADGLSIKEAEIRLNRDGANKLEQSGGRSRANILLSQFSSIIVWLLAFAAVVAWFRLD